MGFIGLLRWLLLFATGLTAVSCGYTMRRGSISLDGKPSDGSTQKIFIPVVDNSTVRTGFEATLTTALRESLALENGIEIVKRPEDANYFLIGNVVGYSREKGPTPTSGTGGTEDQGGLVNGTTTAADIRLTLGVVIKLVQRMPGDVQRLVWAREFGANTVYQTSRRFSSCDSVSTVGAHRAATGQASICGTMDDGSSSNPYINESREQIQFKSLATKVARQVVDQVVQDF